MYPLLKHKTLSSGKWDAFPRRDQILMIANELNRAAHWMEKNDVEAVLQCRERAFELTDLTSEDPKWRGKLKELRRFREILAESYETRSMDGDLNRLLCRELVRFCPESANAFLS